ncbi:MAG: iron-transfer P-loop NTPase [Planctomycetota bacterium]
MTLDALDQAFLDRWRSRSATTAAAAPATAETPPAPPPLTAAAPVAAPTEPAAALADPPAAGVETVDPAAAAAPPADTLRPLSPLASRLLDSAADQWRLLADEIEAARLAGHRVIAITGGEPGEGRTTLVACLATTLARRGRDVRICDASDLAACADGVVGGGRLHDKRIVLVDAGVWFPAGPIRRSRLVVASLGCDAAILVRRADREPTPAWATALAAVGVEPLGEVVTFAPPPAACQETAA